MTILPLLLLLSEWTLDSYNVWCQIMLWFLPKKPDNLICLYNNIINLTDWNFHMPLQLEATYNCEIFTSGVQHFPSTRSGPLVCITCLATSKRGSGHPLYGMWNQSCHQWLIGKFSWQTFPHERGKYSGFPRVLTWGCVCTHSACAHTAVLSLQISAFGL